MIQYKGAIEDSVYRVKINANNRVGWKFPEYLISEKEDLITEGWGEKGGVVEKSKNYIFTVNIKKRI